MTDQVVYHNAAAATISFPCKAAWKYDFGNKDVQNKGNKTSTVRDHNKVLRVFTWTSYGMSRADLDELDGYMRPAAAPTYDGTYPKIVLTKDGSTTENVIGMIIGVDVNTVADSKYNITVVFKERFS